MAMMITTMSVDNWVDLSALRHDILQTFTLFSTFLTTLQQAQPTMTPIPDPTDDDVYPLQPENCCQPVNLLALQQEIRQHMASTQTFFDSLLLSVNDTLCSNNDNNCNGRQHSEPSSYDVTTADHMVHHTPEPSTLQEYLSYQHTAECFVPTCLLCCHALSGLPLLDTHSQCHHRTCCNTSTIIPKHMPKPSFATLSTSAPWISMVYALPKQLNHPLDQFNSTHTFLVHLTCRLCQPTQQYPITNHHHSTMSSLEVPTTIPLHKNTHCFHPACHIYDTDTLLAHIPSVPRVIGKHDLKHP